MRNRFSILLAATLMLLAPCTASAAEISAEKRAVMDELMVMTGMDSVVHVMINGMSKISMDNARASFPDVPEETHDAIQEEITAVLIEEMIEKKGLYEVIYPVYDKYFTLDELKQMVEIYSTPIGKKMIEVMPSLMQESMAAGEQWSMSLLPKIDARIQERLKTEGIEPNSARNESD